MNVTGTADSDDQGQPKPLTTGQEPALPPAYNFAQHNRQRSWLTAPPAYTAHDDWLVFMPHYRKTLPVKMALGVISFGVSAAVIGLTKAHGDQSATYRNPDTPARSDSLTYGTAALAMIWVFFEFLVLFSYKHKTGRRGIHPGGHVLFHATIIAVAIVSAVDSLRFLNSDHDGGLLPETPAEDKERLHMLVQAIAATVLTVGAIHFVLFCFACVEVYSINAGKRDMPVPLHALPRGRLSMAVGPDQLPASGLASDRPAGSG